MVTQAGGGYTEPRKWNQDGIQNVCLLTLASHPHYNVHVRTGPAVHRTIVFDTVLTNFSFSNTEAGPPCVSTVLVPFHSPLESSQSNS